MSPFRPGDRGYTARCAALPIRWVIYVTIIFPFENAIVPMPFAYRRC